MNLIAILGMTVGLALASEPSPEPSPDASPVPRASTAPSSTFPKGSKAEQLLKEGDTLLKAGKKKAALKKFQAARKADPAQLQAMFFELRALTELKRTKKANKLREEILKGHPELKALPMFQPKKEEAGDEE